MNDFSQTYLYKMHRLTNSLDQAFDDNLRRHTDIGVSQFTLLLSVQQLGPVAQTNVAHFLGVSAGAISRQVDIGIGNNWLDIKPDPKDRRKQLLIITESGKQKVVEGVKGLEHGVFDVFKDENRQTNLMDHIETLQRNVDQISS